MNKEINFLRNKQHTTQDTSLVKYVRLASIVLLFLVGTAAIVLFFLESQSPVVALKKQEDAALATLQELHAKAAKLILIDDRIGNINDILKTRTNYIKTMDLFLSKVPQDVVVTTLSINEEKVVLLISSRSLSNMNTFMDNMIVFTSTDKLFKKVIVENISGDVKAGMYFLSLTAEFL